MAKKRKRVKRVLGFKAPKPVGRFLATPGGQIVLAGVIVAAGVAAARSRRVRDAVTLAGHELKRAGAAAGVTMGSASKSVLTPVFGALEQASGVEQKPKRKKRKAGGSPRLDQEEYEARS